MRTRGRVPGMRSSPRYSLYNPRSIARWESEAGDRYIELLKDKGKYRYTGSVPPAPLRDYEHPEEAIGAVRKGPVRVLGHFGHKMRRVYNNRKRPGPKAYRRGFALGRFGGDIAPGLEDYPVIRSHGRAYSAGYDRGLAQYLIATEPRRRVRYNPYRRTKSTMQGWEKIGNKAYRHVSGVKVLYQPNKYLWAVIGGRDDGHSYSTLWAAMSAAARTPAQFTNPRRRGANLETAWIPAPERHASMFPRPMWTVGHKVFATLKRARKWKERFGGKITRMAGTVGPHREAFNSRRMRRNSGKRWIKGAIKRPGALRRKLAAGYVPGYRLGAGRIPEPILARAFAVARRKGDTQTMRQINFARTMLKFRRKAKATRRRYGRKAAN